MKKEIIKKIKKEFEKVEFVECEISKEKVVKEEIKDTFGKNIYEGENQELGYFVFIDLCTLANWSHECEYRFYQENGDCLTTKETWMPNGEIEMEKIKQS